MFINFNNQCVKCKGTREMQMQKHIPTRLDPENDTPVYMMMIILSPLF